MINISQLDKTFRQSSGSCVLASYSIAANYFTGLPVQSFFDAYCRHHKVPTSYQSPEQVYSNHFNTLINAPGQNGYRIILSLHETSNEPEFEKARAFFSCEFIPVASVLLPRLESTLQKEVSLLNLTVGHEVLSGSIMSPVRQLICHSVTLFHDGVSLHTRDTDKDPGQNITPVVSLSSFAQTRDAVLYCKR